MNSWFMKLAAERGGSHQSIWDLKGVDPLKKAICRCLFVSVDGTSGSELLSCFQKYYILSVKAALRSKVTSSRDCVHGPNAVRILRQPVERIEYFPVKYLKLTN